MTDSSQSAAIPVVILVAGATASGKSDLAEKIADKFTGELVNADSMQVYRKMDIGTAKPSKESMARIPHHLFDIVDPDEEFTVADYSVAGRDVINSIITKGRQPVVVGGTGLYIRALFSGLADVPGADLQARSEYNELADKYGNGYLHDLLVRVDPVSAAKMHPNNRIRIIRALEVFNTSGRAISSIQHDHGFTNGWCRTVKIAIDVDRDELYERINRRVDLMIDGGLVEEVRSLLSMGYSAELKALSSIGYKEICSHLSGTICLAEAVNLIKVHSRRYAKRQLTWFKGDPEIKWFKVPIDSDEIWEFLTIATKKMIF
ncbi:MAG: tRNA (adenosine(37)-N6)-dimethylallyltransferase MiaA [Geobacteraceae bacterium]|nr:tRNA (adenosine(37)-N6)-dimethylallyltransferase MiaA [Geobacteraceae bacterium]